jgi:hypothetical protein
MKILNLNSKTYSFDPARYLGFEKHIDNKDDGRFFISGFVDYKNLSKHSDTKIWQLELEDPNRFLVSDNNFNHISQESFFDKVFTICPHTASWLNSEMKAKKRQAVFFPFNEDYIPDVKYKKYDVIYTGHLVSKEIKKIAKDISKFNYRLVSGSNNSLVTDKNIDYKDKLNLMAETKITVVQNLLYLKSKHVLFLWKIKNFEKNKAFQCVPKKNNFFKLLFRNKEITAPQLKSRVFEAAFCKSLILCKRDNFNVIENFFEPEKEFVYYEEGKLKEKITEILSNFEHYEKIINNAYDKAIINYTTKCFCEKYLK